MSHASHGAQSPFLPSPSPQSNYLVFMAELFWWFEVVKPSFVQPRVLRAQGGTVPTSVLRTSRTGSVALAAPLAGEARCPFRVSVDLDEC